MNTPTTTLIIADSILYITGKIVDEKGLPLRDVDVSLGFTKTSTDENGCFLFDGEYPEHPINITISKKGFSTFRDSQKYSGYFIDAVLTEINSRNIGNLIWTELDISNFDYLNINCE